MSNRVCACLLLPEILSTQFFLLHTVDAAIVGIIVESDSNLLVMIDAARTLNDFGVT